MPVLQPLPEPADPPSAADGTASIAPVSAVNPGPILTERDAGSIRRAPSASSLHRASHRVTVLASTTEKVFLRAGTSLELAISRFDRLSAPLSGLAAVAGSGEFSQATMAAEWLSERATVFAEISQPLLDRITSLSVAAESLGADLGSMRQLIRTMSIVALNARVTVASLSDQKAELEVFTTAATGQVSEAAEITEQIAEAVEQMGRRLEQAAGEAANLSHLLRRQLGPALLGLRQDMAAFEKELERATAAGSILMTQGDEFRRAVTAAVLSLQIGDTTRQRLEHVAIILRDAAGQPDAPCLARLSLALAAAHLRDAHERHAAAIVTARAALRDAGQATSDIGRISGSVGMSPRHNLKHHLQRLQIILGACRAAQARLVRVAQDLSDGLDRLLRLLECMSGVEERMSMIGLNAVIACAQLGQEALALREISLQLRELASASAERLGHVARRLSDMGSDAVATAAELEGRFHEDLDELTSTGDNVFSLLTKIESGIAETGAAVDRERCLAERDIAAGIGALDGHFASFAELHSMVPALDRWSRFFPNCPPDEMQSEALARIRSTYTMAAERLVHDTLLRDLGLAVAEEEPGKSSGPAAADLSDFLL
ncbi:chemotaxis protein [Cereibacter azotoformans]|uniref:chemotaxis protein n=1 Tax=Cereibacter azotoformans TaxID=43057 RepID=UPI001EEA5852|nr:chemotaxis protein [Cereibacter azotoformans]ULB09937.1 chemotaxis protein [Cereibacter azotoformans]